jgi:hypothetical protein
MKSINGVILCRITWKDNHASHIRRICTYKKAEMACLKLLPQHSPGVNEVKLEKMSQGNC